MITFLFSPLQASCFLTSLSLWASQQNTVQYQTRLLEVEIAIFVEINLNVGKETVTGTCFISEQSLQLALRLIIYILLIAISTS